ncbi:MAG: hypothetical protein KKG33_11110 [candidate division Zixibacteria bacterium]|nr:hypothetical protein [candidate division Zixibacteria bacterium]MBU1469707.1 hypothetical protein [candidate division Zixibacteria bacterium]MBU2626097.1 hypothetical protein [candidate division Zixibacteria bacterium]
MEKLNFLISAYCGTIKAMFSFRLWTPFFLFAILSLALALVLTNPYLPVIGPIMTGIAEFITGTEAVAHYPDLYALLPQTHGWQTLILSILIEALLIAVGFIMFSGYYRNERIGFGAALGAAKGKYFQVLAIWLFYSVVFLLLLIFLPRLFDPLIGGSPRRTMAFNFGIRLFGSGILAMFMYALPYILLDGEKFVAALGKSVRTFFRNFVSSYVLAVVPYLLVLPLSAALFDPVLIVRRFSPELVLYLLIGQIVANMIASFVFASSVLRFYWEYAE